MVRIFFAHPLNDGATVRSKVSRDRLKKVLA
jgi:hypothetical protein